MDALLIQQHINQQGQLNMTSLKMLLCGLPGTGKTTAMLRLSNQLRYIDPNDPQIPSTGFDKPRTVELYHKTVKRSVVIGGAGGEAEWEYQDLKQQGQTLYSRILMSSPNNMTSSPQFDEQQDAIDEKQAALKQQQASLNQKAVITSLVKAENWDAVREKLKTIEDMTILHMMDCGGHPECHEILPLLLEGRALSLIFLNLTHDLGKTYKVVFRGEEGPSSIQYESVFTARQVLQRILCSISSLQCGANKEKPVAMLVGSYLDQSNEEAVLTLNKSIEEALKGFIEEDILFPAGDQGSKYIATLNNMSEDQQDIEELRRVILTIIKKRFQSKPIPTAWLLLHLLLRDKYEEDPGWCTVEECVKVAVACGIKEEELLGEDGILRYIHKHYGTLLYYPKVAGLSGKVICDPNIILHPFTQTFLYSFACNEGYIQTAKSMRATGEIPHDLMETICATDSADPIPTSEIVDLLKNRYILYENVLTAKGTRSYFMPCLLRPDSSVIKEASDPTTLSSLSPAPLQLVPRSTGYVPLGLFPALVVKMSHTWSLNPRERFRNRIQFCVTREGKPTMRLEFHQHPCYLELRLLHTSSKQASQVMDLSILISCRQQLWEALHQVSSEYPHMKDVVWRFGFYCPDSLQPGGQPHSAVCMTNEDPVDIECLQKPCCQEGYFGLENKHKSWFKSVPLTTDKASPPTADGAPLEHVPAHKNWIFITNPVAITVVLLAVLLAVLLEPYTGKNYMNKVSAPSKGGKNLESCTGIHDARYLIANTVLRGLTDWKLLGEELGLEQYQLQEIQEDHRSYESRRRAMWRKWFDGEEKACWERIIAALVNLDEKNRAATLATSLGLDFSGTQ